MNTLNKRNQNDCDLLTKIRDRIKWDKRVSLADLEIVVQGSSVIVSGYVDTSYKKSAALEVISNTEGVWFLEDRIVVPADYFRADDEINKILKEELEELVKIGGEHIEVSVLDGIVKLEGEVFRPRLKAMAVASAWELSGVRDVVNNIKICDPPRRVRLAVDMDLVIQSSLMNDDIILEDDLKGVS